MIAYPFKMPGDKKCPLALLLLLMHDVDVVVIVVVGGGPHKFLFLAFLTICSYIKLNIEHLIKLSLIVMVFDGIFLIVISEQ